MVMARGEGGGTLCYFIYIYTHTIGQEEEEEDILAGVIKVISLGL